MDPRCGRAGRCEVTAPDQRVANAREYLGYAREVKVGELPLSALMRMAAELRRQLGQVLDVIRELTFVVEDYEDDEEQRSTTHTDVTGGVWLTPPDALTALDALDVAAEYRRYRAHENRRVFTPGDPVPDTDSERADEYEALGRTLRGAR